MAFFNTQKQQRKVKVSTMIYGFMVAMSVLTLSNTYPRAMEIVEIDKANEIAICVDAVGYEWEFDDPEDLMVGDIVICTMYDNGTKETIFDDEIVDVVYSGYYTDAISNN